MKRLAPVLWIALGFGAFVYWSDQGDHQNERTAVAQSDQDDDKDSAGEFHGHDCTVDCSGHQAGYDWAEEHDITDEDDCEGNSESFIEGCKAYVQEQDAVNADEDADPDDMEPDEEP